MNRPKCTVSVNRSQEHLGRVGKARASTPLSHADAPPCRRRRRRRTRPSCGRKGKVEPFETGLPFRPREDALQIDRRLRQPALAPADEAPLPVAS